MTHDSFETPAVPSQHFTEFSPADEAAAQQYAFLAEQACSKIPGMDPIAEPRVVSHVGLIGSGTMGSGIALAFLGEGFAVTLVDRSPEALAIARARIAKAIERQVVKDRISDNEADQQLASLLTSQETQQLESCDLVIEAVFEDMAVKDAVFREIDRIVKPGSILATNTSFLDVDALADVTGRPEDVLGLHFFAPANIMRLLEIVRGARTSDEVLSTGLSLARRLGKVGVVSRVCKGFIANRVMAERRNAANRLLLKGASPQDIDRVIVEYGFPMGPYRMLDLVGLDVGWDRNASASRTVQEVLCEAGDFGQKSGKGYYDYSIDPPRLSPRALAAVEKLRVQSGLAQRSWSDEDILHALLDPVVNEAAKLLEEGIVYRASDIDMALVAGYGWPVFRGGPMFWADTIGLSAIVQRLQERVVDGDDIKISPLLRDRAASGQTFARYS